MMLRKKNTYFLEVFMALVINDVYEELLILNYLPTEKSHRLFGCQLIFF